jgi:hypothetical protein
VLSSPAWLSALSCANNEQSVIFLSRPAASEVSQGAVHSCRYTTPE